MRKSGDSLIAQLTISFTVVAVIVFSAVGFYLYQALVIQLHDRDDVDLVERVLHIRHLLEETSSLESIRVDPRRFYDAVDRQHGLLLLLQTQNGNVLAQNTGSREFTRATDALTSDATLSTADIRSAVLSDGTSIRSIVVYGSIGSTGELVRISLARTSYEIGKVLNAYRFKVLVAAIAGVMLTAGLGYVLVRKGLSRVSALAAQARQVTATNLAMRLSAESSPAELRVLANSFNEVLDRLQASFDNLSQFADDLAHDLRTPLNNLMVQTEVAFSQPRSLEEYQNLLASNHEEFGRLARMVESMLFLARADHDQVALNTSSLDAAAELTKIIEYFEGPASEAQISFAVSAKGDILADAYLLRRAVSNIVANAIRYTPRGGVIALEAVGECEGTTISVTNPGPGIHVEHLPKLFVRFYRMDKSRSSTSLSAGLGLAIVKSIMTLHGGCASVRSEPGRRTTFSLHFPSKKNVL